MLVVRPGLAYAAAVPLATCVTPSKIFTVLPASAVPVNAGVVSLVMLSVFDAPVSLAAVRSGVDGGSGAVLSTVKVVLGPAAPALLPAVSVAVPAAMEIPSVPSPVMPERLTVRVLPVPVTPTVVASAVPVLFNVMLPDDSVLELKLVSVYVTR